MEFIQHTYRKRIETEGSSLRKATSVLHSCRDLRGIRTESFSLRAGAELRRTALTHNLGNLTVFVTGGAGFIGSALV